MILARAPFRVSFVGGGSDLPSFYKRSPGAVVSTTIDKYIYLAIHSYFHDKIRIKYRRTEDVDTVDEIQHPLVRECLRILGVESGMEIASFADVPAGTGMGSSSSFTVALLHALHTLRGQSPTREHLSQEACRVEIVRVGEPIGKQDQYAAGYGGLNYIRFSADESVEVEPIECSAGVLCELEQRLLLFNIGQERAAREILIQQSHNMADEAKFQQVCQMVVFAGHLRQALEAGRLNEVGEILHAGWELKRGLAAGITNELVEDCYHQARQAGAIGGKLLGAGGGGFLLLYCEPEQQDRLRSTLAHLRELPFRFTPTGSAIVYNDNHFPTAGRRGTK